MSLLGRIREWVDGLFAEDGATDEVDEEYLKQMELAYIETYPEDNPDMIRCELCARLFDTMDDCVEHVAGHDGQGSASVDPFAVQTGPYADSEQTDEPYHRYRGQRSNHPTDEESEVTGR
jgi:hypothetical protein